MMDPKLKEKLFDLSEKFSRKVVDRMNSKELESYAREQWRNSYCSDGGASLGGFDEGSLTEDIYDHFQDVVEECQYYRDNGFSDKEIQEIMGDEASEKGLEGLQ